MLRYHADLTEEATARALGIRVGTVKSCTSRALARLRADPRLREFIRLSLRPRGQLRGYRPRELATIDGDEIAPHTRSRTFVTSIPRRPGYRRPTITHETRGYTG